MFIYRDFFTKLFTGQVNFKTDTFKAFIVNSYYIPSDDRSTYSDAKLFKSVEDEMDVLFSAYKGPEGDNSFYINLSNYITWTNVSGDGGFVIIHGTGDKEDMLVACFELGKTLDNSTLEWGFDDYCFKFSQEG